MFKFLDNQNQALPALFMLVSVAAYSLTPLLFRIGAAAESPFLFTSIWQASIGVGVGTIILFFKKGLLFEKTVRKGIKSQCLSWSMLASVTGYCGFALFALGLSFVDVSIATILYNTWPLVMILLMARLFKGIGRYKRLTPGTLAVVFVAMAGVAMVILSQRDTPNPWLVISDVFVDAATWIGVFLVLMSSVGAAAKAFTVRMSASLAENHARPKHHTTDEIAFVIVMTCIGQIASSGILCIIGLALGETISWEQVFHAMAGGFLVNSIGVVMFRIANLKTKYLGVNALSFAIPLVALGWLWMFSILDVPHLDFLIIGAIGIVAANMLINTEADQRIAYSALVVSLWAFGTFIYFHEGYSTDVPLELPVTVFILVLSFRVDRLVRRTAQEEAWVFEAFRRLESLTVKRQIGDTKWRDMLLEIDQHKTLDDLSDAYEQLAQYLSTHMKKAGTARGTLAAAGAVDEIAGIRHLVDNLAHSRQQGAHFGEIVAIALTGALIAIGLLVFNGEREVYGEITSFVLPSVLVFLFFNIIDLQKDRRDRILKDRGGKHGGEYIVKFDDKAKDRKWQQWISVVTSAVIVLVFAWLFVRV